LPVDLTSLTDFQRRVLLTTQQVPRGKSDHLWRNRPPDRSAQGLAGGGSGPGPQPGARRHPLSSCPRLRRIGSAATRAVAE